MPLYNSFVAKRYSSSVELAAKRPLWRRNPERPAATGVFLWHGGCIALPVVAATKLTIGDANVRRMTLPVLPLRDAVLSPASRRRSRGPSREHYVL